MKKRQALVWIILVTMPLLCAFIPAFHTWNIFVTPSFSQNTLQNPATEESGFWEQLKSSLNPKRDDTQSDAGEIKMVYDSISSYEIRFDPHTGLYEKSLKLSDSDYQNIIIFENKKPGMPQAPSITVFGFASVVVFSVFALVVVFDVLAALGFSFYTKRIRKGLALQVPEIKKIISREFLWLLINLVLAIPLTYLFIYYVLDLVAEGDIFTDNEKKFIPEMYVSGYLCIFIGLVLLRIIIKVIKKIC
jgi:hypothetical protein